MRSSLIITIGEESSRKMTAKNSRGGERKPTKPLSLDVLRTATVTVSKCATSDMGDVCFVLFPVGGLWSLMLLDGDEETGSGAVVAVALKTGSGRGPIYRMKSQLLSEPRPETNVD